MSLGCSETSERNFLWLFSPTAVPAHQILAFPEQTNSRDWTVAPELFLPEAQVSCALQLFGAAFPCCPDLHVQQVLKGGGRDVPQDLGHLFADLLPPSFLPSHFKQKEKETAFSCSVPGLPFSS